MPPEKSKASYLVIGSHGLLAANIYLYVIKGYYPIAIVFLFYLTASLLHHLNLDDIVWDHGHRFFLCGLLMLQSAYAFKYCTLFELVMLLMWLGMSLLPEQLESVSFQLFRTMWLCMVFFGNVLLWTCLP
jgi:hypothetical protein